MLNAIAKFLKASISVVIAAILIGGFLALVLFGSIIITLGLWVILGSLIATCIYFGLTEEPSSSLEPPQQDE